MCGRDGLPGIEAGELLELIAMADDLVDLWDVTSARGRKTPGRPVTFPEGSQQPWTHRVREATAKPVGAVGRYRRAAADVLDYGAELVVIATGSAWRGDGVQPGAAEPITGVGTGPPRVLIPEQVMAGQRPPGRQVVVYDTDGYFTGPGVAARGGGARSHDRDDVRRAVAGQRPDPGRGDAARAPAPPRHRHAVRRHGHRHRRGLGARARRVWLPRGQPAATAWSWSPSRRPTTSCTGS
ncbi:MAG: hypothetical protein ACLP7J_22980 [Streptosporangiaceae bacterium]